MGASYLRQVLHLALQRAVVGNFSTVESLRADAVSVIPTKDRKRSGTEFPIFCNRSVKLAVKFPEILSSIFLDSLEFFSFMSHLKHAIY